MEKENKAFEAWKAGYLGSPKVWARYVQFLERFCEWKGIDNPEELYQLRKADLKSDDSRDTKRVENWIKQYWQVLTTEGTYYTLKSGARKNVVLKPQTANHFIKAMRSFFEAQNQPLSMNLKEFNKLTPEGQGRDIVNKDEIALAYRDYFGNNKERNRALLMVGVSSGLRCSDIVALDVENYINADIVKNEAKETFRVFRPQLTKKNKVNALIHLGPEACEAVDQYLKIRGNVNPGDPLFLDDEGKRMSSVTLTMQFDRMFEKMGTNKNLGGHSLRKFYITSLQGAGLSDNWIKKLCGKKLSRGDAGYVKPEDLGLLTPAYIKGFESLRIFKRSEVTKEEMENLTAQNISLTERVRELEGAFQLLKYDRRATEKAILARKKIVEDYEKSKSQQ